MNIRQPRTLWPLLFAVALCVVFGVALWDQFWRDTTTRYVRSDVSVYVRVSVPKYYATSQFESGVEAFLDDVKLPIDARDIKREIAFTQYAVGSSSVSQVIIRTDRLSSVEEKLRVSSLAFKRLSGEHLIVSLDKQIILPSQDEGVLKINRTRGKSLIVYLAPQGTASSEHLMRGMFGVTSESMLWYGEARRGGVVLYPVQTSQPPTLQPLIGDARTFVWTQDQFQLSPYLGVIDRLTQMGKWPYLLQIDSVLAERVFSRIAVVATPKSQSTSSGWILADYDWRVELGIDDGWTTDFQVTLEQMIASLVAFEVPQPAVRRLSDGTPVAVIRPNPNNWEFIQGDTEHERVLEIPDRNTRISIEKADKALVITNNKAYQSLSIQSGEYGQLPAQLLPTIAPWRYLQAFSSLTVDNSGIILR